MKSDQNIQILISSSEFLNMQILVSTLEFSNIQILVSTQEFSNIQILVSMPDFAGVFVIRSLLHCTLYIKALVGELVKNPNAIVCTHVSLHTTTKGCVREGLWGRGISSCSA